MTPLTSSTSTVLVLGLTSDKRSLMDLRTIADWTLRPRLLAVPGITKVSVFGGETRSIQVAVHPDELIRYNLGFNEVLGAARKATGIRGAGFIDTANQRIVFQSEGQSLKADDIARTVLVSEGALKSAARQRRRRRGRAGTPDRWGSHHGSAGRDLGGVRPVRRQHA